MPEHQSEFGDWIRTLQSKEIRYLLGLSYAELCKLSEQNAKSISDQALDILKEEFTKMSNLDPDVHQPDMFGRNAPLGVHGTFSPNRAVSLHRWYPYVEGFSSTFVSSIIEKYAANAQSVYDPFGGTGTTLLVSATRGLSCFYSEINPFMRLVIEAKTNDVGELISNRIDVRNFLENVLLIAKSNVPTHRTASKMIEEAFPGRPYFHKKPLCELIAIKLAIADLERTAPPALIRLAKVAVGSIVVASSNMKRAADLRYRTEKEMLPESFSAFERYAQKITEIANDIHGSSPLPGKTTLLTDSAFGFHNQSSSPAVDLVLTSPPYLNGTNYFRNTKLELWITSLINSERDLVTFTRAAMTAGINNVSKYLRPIKQFEFVETVAKQLDNCSYDKRIPQLVRSYCTDTYHWFERCKNLLNPGGRLIVDIGDSRFAGVHVPTDKFLIQLAELHDLSLKEMEFIRSRKSKDGMKLKQVLLVFEKA